ncbi:hypothetical protein HYDPIDRAFT_98139 [Hydnomerulius pinastri MD-312]|uniref:Uncharacterized protein n=1 Tax=Hydnomerulius pinastri MD-312 TaxID=994086 RepID=A0A0C9WBF3_9AGAM|nr:hypothetical protein HYDPIDRAFT_98139 [Hydnomerulius pinastri MD-312]
MITKGKFELEYSSDPKHEFIALCSLLLMVQFLAQLLLIPLSTFFGQVMYLVSFIASGGYHLFVVSHEREKVQREALSQRLGARLDKREFGSRTQMSVFVCMVLGDCKDRRNFDPNAILMEIIPNKTNAWVYWRKRVVEELERQWNFPTSHARLDSGVSFTTLGTSESNLFPTLHPPTTDLDQFSAEEQKLLNDLFDDAWSAMTAYYEWRLNRGREQTMGESSQLLGSIA